MRHVEGCETGVATNVGDEFVTRGWLWDRDTAFIEIFFEIRFRPGLVEPITRVSCVFSSLLCDGLVVLANTAQETVTSSWLRSGNIVVIEE